MITVTNVLGNIKKDPALNQRYEELLPKNLVESVTIQRSESEKSRMRKTSDRGTDIGFILPSRTRIKDKDVVFLDDEKMILVKVSPELVAVLSFKDYPHNGNDGPNNPDMVGIAIKVGHTIGNLHRPLKLEENRVVFPIQSLDELGLFQRLLSNLQDHFVIRSDNMVFEPDQGFDIHGH